MKQTVLKRLFESFTELERAITSARETLEKKDSPPADVLKRIDSYDEILRKQRSLATALCGHVAMENWSEVTRHVQLINAMSAMIRDDAREVLAGVGTKLSPAEREMMLS